MGGVFFNVNLNDNANLNDNLNDNDNLNANLNLNINFARWRSHFFSLQKKTEKTEKNRNCLPTATLTLTLNFNRHETTKTNSQQKN